MHTPFGSSTTQFFYELTPERILTAVESLGLRLTGRCLQLNSMENRVYEVELEIEDEAALNSPSERFRIVKFYRPGRWSREQILDEHAFLLELIEREIPVVAPYVHDQQETLFELPGTNISFSIFAKAGGRNPQELDDEQMLQVGRLLARLHNVGALQEAKHRLRLSPESFTRPSLEFLLGGSFIPQNFSRRYQSLVEQIIEQSSPLFAGVPLQRIHGDAHLGNLLWGSAGAFWVDFDDMSMGPCVQDIWLVVPGRDDYAKQKLNLLLEGYEQFREFDYRTLKLIEPLRAMRIIHFNAWIAKRWEDPAFREVFVTFGSAAYWQEQIHALEEQVEVIGQSL